jgi:hypothetical protein
VVSLQHGARNVNAHVTLWATGGFFVGQDLAQEVKCVPYFGRITNFT